MRSKQETFDYVVNFLRKQGKQSRLGGNDSLLPSNTCAYRGLNGLKCAVGCLIPDELYDPRMEGMVVQDLTMFCIDLPYMDMLVELQHVHDGDVMGWEDGFRRIANEFCLNYSPPAGAIIMGENTLPTSDAASSETHPVATAS